ncbi:MAG TPA: ATP-binding protein [Acidimicrobiales bacterium]|nr:ATP-binding protein [Acidimicrobiales bacterium]
MEAALGVLRNVQTVLYVGLGVSAFWAWHRRRGPTRAWMAGTFGVLAVVTLVGLLLPDENAPRSSADWASRTVLMLIVLFPYFLFRFAASFRRRPEWVEVGALALTIVLGLSVYLFDELPRQGEAWGSAFGVWVLGFLVQWVSLSAVVAFELWRSGHGQPTVSRRRMRLLSFGSIGLALALVLAGAAGSGGGSTTSRFVVQLLSLASAPLFLLGFNPPRFLLAAWRRPELLELRSAEEVLMRAVTQSEVGERLLPHVTRIVGGKASVLVDRDGHVLGVDGVSLGDVGQLLDPTAKGHRPEEIIVIPLRSGRLVVQATPYTPYFARSETELLDTLATFTDLALSRAELSERERQTAIELHAANEAMREFVAIASHDLRTPVTVIKGFASALESDRGAISAEQRQQHLGTIRRHADHLGVIIDDLLTTSRLDAGVIEPTPTEIELGPFLRRLAIDLHPDVPVTVDVGPADLRIRVDCDHLQRMVTNYLENAFRYGEPPVTLRARLVEEFVEIAVCDEGRGVPPEFVDRAFEKFARVDKRHSKESQGTGLGLAIVRGLARASGGDAWFVPNVRDGACFALRLPVSGPS